MDKLILAIDQGTGGTKSVLFSAAGEVAWLNPFRPEVQQLITDLVLEVVGRYGADGIQFDDHMSLPREFGPYTLVEELAVTA